MHVENCRVDVNLFVHYIRPLFSIKKANDKEIFELPEKSPDYNGFLGGGNNKLHKLLFLPRIGLVI